MNRALAVAAVLFLAMPAQADMYPDASNAALPQAQHNLGQSRSIVPQQYGAKGDGVADDTAAVQAWLNALKTGAYLGQCGGIFRLTASVNAFPANSYRVDGQGAYPAAQPGGCQFKVDYNGWSSAAIDLTNPTPANSSRGGAPMWSNVSVTYNPALTAPPIGIRHRYSSDLTLANVGIYQYTANWGTCLSISAAWNVRLRDVQVWGCGGNVSSHLRTSETFSIAAGGTALTSSASFFSAADVGLDIALSAPSPREVFRITGYTDPTTVTVGRAANVARSGSTAALSSITGAMTAASPTLTTNLPKLTSADVGRAVYVLGAGATSGTAVSALRSMITAVSGAAVTLADAANTTVAAGASVIISPAVEVYGEEAGVITNDILMTGLHVEQHAGTALVIHRGVNVRGDHWKLHGPNNSTTLGQTNQESQFAAALVQTDLQLGQGEIEGTAVTTLGQILIQGITAGANTLQMLGGFVFTGQPKVAISRLDASQGVTIGTINTVGQVGAGSPAVTTDGTGAGILGQGAVTAQASGVQLPLLIGTLPKAPVASLPLCWAPFEGRMYAVSDAASIVFNAVVTGGGTNRVIAYCNGAQWVVH